MKQLLIWLWLIGLIGCSDASKTTPSLHILAGSELKDIASLIPQIEQHTGVKLQLEYSGTLDAVERVAAGEAFDALWVSHGKYLQLTADAGKRIKLSEKTMLSPVVLGLKQTRAQSLGWCNNPNVTWADIANAAEQGKFSFGMTNPASSNSGFTALIGLTSALSGKADALTLEDVKTNKTSAFFKAQRLTAGSSGWLVEAFLRDQTQVDGLINYESVLLLLNQNAQLTEHLCLIYPKEGIITADYPFMLLNSSRQAEYERVLTYIRSAEFQQPMMQQSQRRPVNASVKLAPSFPSALLIELPFPGQLEVINALLENFQNSIRIPAHSWFVLDTSGSMASNGGIEQLRTALAGLAGDDPSLSGRLTDFMNREKIAITTFANYTDEAIAFDMGNTEAQNQQTRHQISDFAQQLTAQGGTAIYDAVRQSYQAAQAARQKEGNRYYQSLVLMTDGRNISGDDFGDFQDWYQSLPAAEQGIRVFAIAFGDADMDELQQLANLTGGRVFDGRTANLRQVFKEIRGYQ